MSSENEYKKLLIIGTLIGLLGSLALIIGIFFDFFTLGVDRKGRLVDKHNLWHMIGNAYKKMILPGATDLSSYKFAVPYWVKGDITVMARLRYRRFNKWFTDWVFEDVQLNDNTGMTVYYMDMALDATDDQADGLAAIVVRVDDLLAGQGGDVDVARLENF